MWKTPSSLSTAEFSDRFDRGNLATLAHFLRDDRDFVADFARALDEQPKRDWPESHTESARAEWLVFIDKWVAELRNRGRGSTRRMPGDYEGLSAISPDDAAGQRTCSSTPPWALGISPENLSPLLPPQDG